MALWRIAESALKRTHSLPVEERGKVERIAYFPYVLALIEAGQLPEAIQALHAMPAIDQDRRANNFDKLALGWVADKCGLHEHAQKLLQEVEPSKAHEPHSVFDLAQKRLKCITDTSLLYMP